MLFTYGNTTLSFQNQTLDETQHLALIWSQRSSELYYIQRVRHLDGKALIIDINMFLRSLVPGLTPEIARNSIYDYIENTLGMQIVTSTASEKDALEKALSLKEILAIPGAKAIMLCFFCYCAIEQTTMLWASSYLNLAKDVDAKTAASFAGMFCIGITISRGINGFIAMKLKDRQMIRMGQAIILTGIIVMLLPFGQTISLIGFSLIGLGCAPIYPCIIHSTPEHFGAERSQAIIGVQMASAYIGTCLMPPLFGLIANHISIRLLPFYLLILLVLMVCMHEILERKVLYEYI